MIHVFISDGRLYIHDENGSVNEIESDFVKQKLERSERQTHYHSWKNNASTEDAYFNSSVVWGKQANAGLATSYRFKDVIVADENTLYYVLNNGVVTGLFEYDLSEKFETRLFHKNDLISWGIDFSAKRREFVMAVQDPEGRVCLELLNQRGSSLNILTGGDSRDSYPSFSHHNSNHVLFQSAGIARDEDGYAFLYGPEAVYRLDLESEEMTEVLSDDNYDFLLPKADQHGNLYCIRRPYKQPGKISLGKKIMNALLFPVHFIGAVVGFLEAFTKLFNQQAFKTGGPDVQLHKRDKHVRIFGQVIELAKVQRNAKYGKGPSLVPGSWELMRMTPQKETKVIARNVASYDIDNEGNLFVTNGYKVNKLSDNEKDMVFRHNLIETLKICRFD